MDCNPFGRASNSGVPRKYHQSIWQRRSHSIVASIWSLAQRPQANLGWLHWLPEHGQVVGDKRAAKEESVQRGANCGRDKSVAVHYAHEAHLFDRLSGRCVSAWGHRD